jgi:hypothetical protein
MFYYTKIMPNKGGFVDKIFSMKSFLNLLVGSVIALSPLTLYSENAVEECSRELLLAYFPEAFVKETLKKFNVPQDKWEAITKSLNEKDKEVVKIVEEKASKLNPNPLKDPQQRQEAVKIFRETLLQVFSDAMKQNGITDEKQIQSMLDNIQQQKAKRFAQCMEKQRSGSQEPSQQPQANPKLGQNDPMTSEESDDDES